MTPDTQVHFITGDVRTMPPETFDGFHSMIVDPPYSEYVHKHMASHGVHGRGSRERDPGFDYLDGPSREHLARIAARMSRWSVVFTDHESTHLWRSDVQMAGDEYIRLTVHTPDGYGVDAEPALNISHLVDLVAEFDAAGRTGDSSLLLAVIAELGPSAGLIPWVRWSQPQLSGDRPPQGSEAVLHFHRVGAKSTNCRGNLIAYTRRCLRGADKHPTEKPLDLMLDMVSWWSDPGENVLDPMAGSGTTALACKLLGRSCVAIEQDPKWAEYFAARDVRIAGRDRDRAIEFVETTTAEASEILSKPPAKNGEDQNTRRRAQARLDDASRVRAAL